MDKVSDVKKPSIDSRFSVETHGDPETLKKEFRIFAKQYHPGTADISEATELFQDISAEYEQLQNYLSSWQQNKWVIVQNGAEELQSIYNTFL